jgi:hypothetical protein
MNLGSFSIRAERVLSATFRGLHHCPKIKKSRAGNPYEVWETNVYNDLSTFDFDLLTRLVISCHDECIRATIGSSGPGMVKIQLWPRFGREGSILLRHPTIEQAIESFRKS